MNKVQIAWLPDKNIYPVRDSQSKTVKKGFNYPNPWRMVKQVLKYNLAQKYTDNRSCLDSTFKSLKTQP